MNLDTVETPAPERPAPAGRSGRRVGDRVFQAITTTVGAVVLAVLSIITVFLFVKAWPALHSAGLGFFTETKWFPDTNPPTFGVAALLWGTLLSSVIALLIAAAVLVLLDFARAAHDMTVR